jgi:hypothetical protein
MAGAYAEWGILAERVQSGWFMPGDALSLNWRPYGYFGEVVVSIGDAQLPANRVHPANASRYE